ncbi:MAG: hypothetical protein IPK16_30675 [Anaerolineales bacterium]|nr:hypothetical protein [Anaerolineales bacterium]
MALRRIRPPPLWPDDNIVAYHIINNLMQVDVNDVLRVFLVILIGGLFFSAVKVQNPLWWEKSFSYLGTHFSDDRTVFNATIIISGILLIILQQYFMEDFYILRDHGRLTSRQTNVVRGSLIALGVLMMFVGIFPF